MAMATKYLLKHGWEHAKDSNSVLEVLLSLPACNLVCFRFLVIGDTRVLGSQKNLLFSNLVFWTFPLVSISFVVAILWSL